LRRVLGLDPGTRHFGWGVVERTGTKFVHIAHGIVSPKPALSLGERLVVIASELEQVVAEYTPFEVSLEAIFFAKDPQASAKLGHARGVAMLVCARAGLAIAEYPPARVKVTTTGHGRADKAQVAQMMRVILGLAVAPPADAADALACAVTHLQRALVSAAGLPTGKHEATTTGVGTAAGARRAAGAGAASWAGRPGKGVRKRP
jgi:crossover junction endodeoxyribonuclease RuvC